MNVKPSFRSRLPFRPRAALFVGLLYVVGCAAPAAPAPPRSPPAAPLVAPSAAPAPAAPGVTAEAPAPPVDARTARLTRLIKLWGAVRFHHPAFLTRDVDWDGAFCKALPKIEAAADDDQEAAALDEMLRSLGDPATRVVRRPASVPAGGKPAIKRLEGDVLLVTLAPADRRAMSELRRELGEALPKAKGVVVDLRSLPFDPRTSPAAGLFAWLTPRLIAREVLEPPERIVQRLGYPTDGPGGSIYYATFRTEIPALIKPANEAGAGPRPRLAVIVGRESEVPMLGVLLQREAGAALVAEGKLSDAIWPVSGASPLPLVGDHLALIRSSEAPSLEPARADAEVPRSGAGDAALATALRLLKRPAPPRAEAAKRPPEAAAYLRHDALYEGAPYPDRAHRLLALARAWTVLDLFWPHKPLLGPGAWPRALVEALPAFEAARDEREYVLALAALGARTHDSHVDISGGPANRLFDPMATMPIEVQRVEGRPVVTRVFDEAKGAGVAVGDVVEAADGEAFEARVARLGPYVAGSTPWHHAYRTDALALSGAMGPTVALMLRDGAGRVKEARLPRADKDWSRAGPAYRMLESGVGYVDLVRFNFHETDAMLEALGSAPAIVLDLRGRPRYVPQKLAARLNRLGATHGAIHQRPVVGGGSWSADGPLLQASTMLIPPADKPPYAGRTVVLVDERAYSLAEYDGQFLRAAAGSLLVGSPSAGVDGDLTSVGLPGGVFLWFSGADVRLPDGGVLQRVGLRPDVAARPTLRGLREGRDEVLERALRLLREGR